MFGKSLTKKVLNNLKKLNLAMINDYQAEFIKNLVQKFKIPKIWNSI